MHVCQYSVAMDECGRNVLVKDSASDSPCLDKLDSPDGAAQLMRDVFGLHTRAEEYVYLICLMTSGRPIGFFEVSHGTCSTAPLGPREILVRALLCGAANILIVHNHPSGDMTPSRADNEMTERMREAADLIGIGLCDHIIIGGWGHYSYRAAGKLDAAV